MLITCARVGKRKDNYKGKGRFKMNFKNLDELARFQFTNESIWYPCIHQELSRKELKMLGLKVLSMMQKGKDNKFPYYNYCRWY